MNATRILIADDQELVLHGLARVIHRAHPEWEIVGLAIGGEEALRLGRLHRPSFAVFDLAMRERSGIEVAERLLSELGSMRTVMLVSQVTDSLVRRLQKAGVYGCLAKHDVVSQLATVLEQVVAGRTALACMHHERNGTHGEPVAARFLLTARELTVMHLLAEGKTNKLVATELDLSVRTVESHRASILNKLGINSIGDLVRVAVRDGMI